MHHLLWSVQLVCVLVEQVEGLSGALPLVHVAGDEDALHAHVQLSATFPSLVVAPGPVALLAPFPRVAGRGRHISSGDQPPLGSYVLALANC